MEQTAYMGGGTQDLTRILGEVGRTLLTTLDLHKLLEKVAESAHEVLGADIVTLYEYNAEENQFVVPPIIKGDLKDRSPMNTPVYKDDIVARLFARGKSHYARDAQHDKFYLHPWGTGEEVPARDGYPARKRFPIREGILSSAGLVLEADEQKLGVMFVSFRTRHSFEQDECTRIELFAQQAALAIRNARLVADLEKQVQTLAKLQEVGRTLLATLELPKLLQKVAESAYEVLGADIVTLYEYEAEEDRFVVPPVIVGDLREPDPMNTPIYKDDIVVRLLEREEPYYYARDAQHDEFYMYPWGAGVEVPARNGYPARKRFPIREGILSSAGLVLEADEQKLGVMFVSFRTRHSFEQDECTRIELFAQQAALAIRNARLVADLGENVQNLTALYEVGQALTSGIRLEEPQVLELIQQQASRLMPMDSMYIALYDEGMDTVRFGLAMQHGRRLPNEYFQAGSSSGWAPRSGGQGRTEEIIHTRKPIFHKTKTEAEAWYAQAGRKEYLGQVFHSWIGVPMMVGEKVLGVLAAYHPTLDYAYDETDFQVLTTLASQAAIALDNARLYYRVNRNLGALNEVGRVLTSGIRLEEPQVLELIQQQASRLMPMDSMYIALYDEGMDTVRFGLAMQHGRRLPNEYFQAGSSSGWAPRSGGQGRTEEIIHTRKPIFHKTKTEAEAWYAQAGRKEYLGQVSSSWIGVPMMVGEKALGVIAAYHPTLDYAYDEADFQVLTILASQAAIALDNARLLKRERRWAERLKALHEVSRELAASVDPGRVSSLILEKAVQLTGAHYGTLQIVDEKAEELVLNLVYPPEVRPTDQSFARIPLGTGITGWAAQHRQPLLVRDVKNNDRYLPFLSDTRSELAVPLFVEGQLVRILNVEHKEVRGLDEQDQELLISFANLAAGVIQNVRQYEALREEQRKTRAAARLTAMNAVAAGLVHRLTNVAGTIPVWVRQTSELLDPSDPKYSRVVHLLDAINKDVDGILATAQAISSSTEATEPLELVDVALLVSSAIKRIAVPAGITICDKCGEDLPKVLVFSGKLIDTLENVIRNGIEAIDGLGSVTIVGRALTEEDHDWLTLSVEDTGRGIAPEDLPKIFDLFYSTKGGMGFGLWGSKALIESLGGKIAVSSEVGKGTTFTVFLPLEKEAQR